MSDAQINTRVKLDFEQRARAVSLEDVVSDDEYATAAEIIFLRDANANLLEALKLLYKEMDLSGNLGSKQYGWPEATTKAQAAIAKAEGQS
jgi:hypothetical protein